MLHPAPAGNNMPEAIAYPLTHRNTDAQEPEKPRRESARCL
ncbi:Uncharacterised protein [Halioglobus japonicus]|nr:Uncharacterised protein [Halioglobus japonicus]